MRKKIIILIAIFIIGISFGIISGMFTSNVLEKLTNYDYICGIETSDWSDCKEGEWSESNFSSKERVLSTGMIIPKKSRIYNGFKTKNTTLKYGNTKDGCNGKLLFSSVNNNILKIRDNKGNIHQEIDIDYGGEVTMQSGLTIKYTPQKQRACTKKELLEN